MKKKYKLLPPKISINWKIPFGYNKVYHKGVYFYLINNKCHKCKTYCCWYFASAVIDICCLCELNARDEDFDFYKEMIKKSYNYWKKNNKKRAEKIFAKMFADA